MGVCGMKNSVWIKTILAVACIAGCAAADIIWPSEGSWTALMQGTDYYYDAAGDKSPGAIDLIGMTGTYSAGYWALVEDGHVSGGVTDDAFMFRLRIGGSGGKFAWQVSLDTDGDVSNVEWILQLVGSGPPAGQGVELIQTAVGGPTLGDVDIGSNTAAWIGETSLCSRWTAIPDTPDYHVDLAVPWDTFTTITGVIQTEQLGAVLSTSPAHNNINGDFPLGATISEQISNVLTDNIPEPAVASLLLSSGIGLLAFRRIFNRQAMGSESPE